MRLTNEKLDEFHASVRYVRMSVEEAYDDLIRGYETEAVEKYREIAQGILVACDRASG